MSPPSKNTAVKFSLKKKQQQNNFIIDDSLLHSPPPPMPKCENNEKINRENLFLSLFFCVVLVSDHCLPYWVHEREGKACLDCHMIYNLFSRHLNTKIFVHFHSFIEPHCSCESNAREWLLMIFFFHRLSLHVSCRLILNWRKNAIEGNWKMLENKTNKFYGIFQMKNVLKFC